MLAILFVLFLIYLAIMSCTILCHFLFVGSILGLSWKKPYLYIFSVASLFIVYLIFMANEMNPTHGLFGKLGPDDVQQIKQIRSPYTKEESGVSYYSFKMEKSELLSLLYKYRYVSLTEFFEGHPDPKLCDPTYEETDYSSEEYSSESTTIVIPERKPAEIISDQVSMPKCLKEKYSSDWGRLEVYVNAKSPLQYIIYDPVEKMAYCTGCLI